MNATWVWTFLPGMSQEAGVRIEAAACPVCYQQVHWAERGCAPKEMIEREHVHLKKHRPGWKG